MMLTRIEVTWPKQIPARYRKQTFVGILVKSYHQDPPGTIRLRTGLYSIGESVIPKKYITRQDETEVDLTPDSATTEVFYVPSSKKGGGKYEVRFSDARWICTCKGFQYHGHCRHIKIVAGEDLPKSLPKPDALKTFMERKV